MKIKIIKAAFVCACFGMVAVPVIHAQGRGPGGGPPPGGFSGPVNPNGQGNGPSGNTQGPNSNGNFSVNSARAPIATGPNARMVTVVPGPVGRWWDDNNVVRQVGITHAQQQKMDTIFDANRATLVSQYKTLQQQQAKLDALTKDSKTDQATLFAAIDAVNQARAALQKTTVQTLLQIRQQMNSGQITKLESLK